MVKDYVAKLGARDLVRLQHVVEDVVDLLPRHARFDLVELLAEGLNALLVNLELGKSVVSRVDVVSERSWLSRELIKDKTRVGLASGDLVGADDVHLLVQKVDLIRLLPQAIGFTATLVDLLEHLELLDLAVFLDDLVIDDVDSGGLQPSVAPTSEVLLDAALFGGSRHVLDEVWQLSVLESILLEVGLDAFREDASTELEEHLVEPSGSFAVGDTIEDVLTHFSVDHINTNRVSCVHLVLSETPEALIQEDGPSRFVLLESRGLIQADVAHEVGEGFVEPQIVPPLHSHEVAEPHVTDLVKEHVEDGLLSSIREHLVSLDVLVPVDHTADILHCSSVEIRNKDRIHLSEGILCGE